LELYEKIFKLYYLADLLGKFNLKSNNNRGVGVRRRRSEASSNPPLFAIKIKLPAAGKAAGKRNAIKGLRSAFA